MADTRTVAERPTHAHTHTDVIALWSCEDAIIPCPRIKQELEIINYSIPEVLLAETNDDENDSADDTDFGDENDNTDNKDEERLLSKNQGEQDDPIAEDDAVSVRPSISILRAASPSISGYHVKACVIGASLVGLAAARAFVMAGKEVMILAIAAKDHILLNQKECRLLVKVLSIVRVSTLVIAQDVNGGH